MEAIVKKMQAMKVEKDNACDRVDVCEEQCKAARVISYFDCKENIAKGKTDPRVEFISQVL